MDPLVAENIRRALQMTGRSAYSVAVAMGHAPNWLYQVLSGKAGLLVPTLRALAEELHLPAGALIDPPDEAAHLSNGKAHYAEDHDAIPHLAVLSEPADTPDTRCLTVWDVESAAGGGALFDQEAAVGCIPFRRAWLDRHAIDATLAAIIGVRGESMEPTLPHGSAILVDRGRRRRRVGSIYVVRSEDGLLVKRAGKADSGEWQLVSDHLEWPAVPWPARAEVIGQVRWMARTLG